VKLPIGKRAMLIIGVPLGLAVSGGLAYFQLAGTAAAPPVPDPAEGQYGVMLALDERVVNLPTGGIYRYVKIGVTVELRPESESFYELTGESRSTTEVEALAKLEPAVPLALDAVGNVVSQSDGATLTTTDGRARLKDGLMAAMRGIFGETEVLDVYLTDLVLQ
jgi:flagellar basal body-associated protein FliL